MKDTYTALKTKFQITFKVKYFIIYSTHPLSRGNSSLQTQKKKKIII